MIKQIGILCVLAAALLAGPIEKFAAENGYETVYETAVAKARKAKKPVMLVMVTNYCPWCRKFEKRTLRAPDVDAAVHRRFVPLILNREKHEFPERFDTPRIPMVFVVDPFTEETVRSAMGHQKRDAFLAFVDVNATDKQLPPLRGY